MMLGRGVSFDHLKVWEIETDWANSRITQLYPQPFEIATDPFDAGEIFGQGAVSSQGQTKNLLGTGELFLSLQIIEVLPTIILG